MKRFFITIVCLLCGITSFADVTVDSVLVKTKNALGLDTVYDFELPELTKSPKGYRPVFVEHYGRHGSRFAYNQSFYSMLKDALDRGLRAGVLTPYGKELKDEFDRHYAAYTLNMGDLSPLGWEQQRKIGTLMYDNFRQAFPKGAKVYASASSFARSIMSMSSLCLGLQKKNPDLEIIEHVGCQYLKATSPRDKKNPFPVTRPQRVARDWESVDSFQDRRIDSGIILGRLFTDIDAACGELDKRDFVRRLYVLASGMASIPEEMRTDFTGLFTEEEFAGMWLVDNYQRYLEYYMYLVPCKAVVDDIIEDADRRIKEKEAGATLRFGHDHVVMPLYEAMGIDGYATQPASPDMVSRTFHSWDSPMAANIQIVFYLSKKAGDPVLFKVLRNGREARLEIETDKFPYYRWEDFKSWY